MLTGCQGGAIFFGTEISRLLMTTVGVDDILATLHPLLLVNVDQSFGVGDCQLEIALRLPHKCLKVLSLLSELVLILSDQHSSPPALRDGLR